MARPLPDSIDETQKLLASGDYVADRSLATSLFLALAMRRPLFLEGEAGVGKTEIGKVIAQGLGRELIRLQCYEGLDIAQAAYEWNYSRQMIEIRLAEAAGEKSKEKLAADIYSEKFLIKRPLARALEGHSPVLLIDELDRTDEPFEAYLLEVLSDWQITIPEVGTLRAPEPPIVVITSNRPREIHDAVKLRCFYHWVDFPDAPRELEILRRKAPGAREALSREVVGFVQRLRQSDLFKQPGVAETIDWANCLVALDRVALDPETVNNTLGVLLKYRDDLERVAGEEAADQAAVSRHRFGPHAPPALVVQPRVPAHGAHRLAHLCHGAGKADPVRGGARDPGLARSAPAPRGRPALLRLLPPAASRRADHLHRGGAHARHERARAAAPRFEIPGRDARERRLRDVLLD